jgi:glycosyltransferase involved in cell wall biosynthesis
VLPIFPDAELVMLCNDVPSHPNVTVLRGISDQELAQSYASAWLFCYPSIYEGFGMAYMEAMASGTAILSSPNTGADDVLDHGKYGLISEDEDFAKNLIRLLQNPSERHAFEQLGLMRCANYHVDQVVTQHLHHYRAVLD